MFQMENGVLIVRIKNDVQKRHVTNVLRNLLHLILKSNIGVKIMRRNLDMFRNIAKLNFGLIVMNVLMNLNQVWPAFQGVDGAPYVRIKRRKSYILG